MEWWGMIAARGVKWNAEEAASIFETSSDGSRGG